MDVTKNQMELTPSQKQAALRELLSLLMPADSTADQAQMSEEEKLKAAYALNLCTVSVSQIIDYNDIFFLEQEYEAILNNLNLEEMPKDEALLRILKQLLDVITYFRIQEGEKKLLEKEYQQKMKNAIWNAVPNIGMIVAGGNPITMAISLASQVGIGYMNYRREKAKIGLEQERKEWELQRSAMEQFNGLRRELFDTAWRLADRYKFPDSYRLTERQITQYNRILMDSDDMRRYERLYSIRNYFEAYPPYWYYLGSAANAVYQNEDRYYGYVITGDYKQYAKDAFRKFIDSTKRNLLREDQIEASCALELFDLLEESEKAEKIQLLERAKRASGNAYDVLELCAISYLKIGETEMAAELLRMLVNEGYNTDVNAQILSKLYVSQVIAEPSEEIRKRYLTLAVRVGSEKLFPMPSEYLNKYELEEAFMYKQQQQLRESYIRALQAFIEKYSGKYDALCRRNGNITNDMLSLLEQMCSDIKIIVPDPIFRCPLHEAVTSQRQALQEMLASSDSNGKRKRTVTFWMVSKEAFASVARNICARIQRMDTLDQVTMDEIDLNRFCSLNNLNVNETTKTTSVVAYKAVSLHDALLDEQFQRQQMLSTRSDQCVQIISEIIGKRPLINPTKKGNTYLYLKGEPYFDDYLKKNEQVLLGAGFKNLVSIVAIINDRSMTDMDLILSTGGIMLLTKKRLKGVVPYSEVSDRSNRDSLSIGGSDYSKKEVNMNVLVEISGAIAKNQRINKPAEGDDVAELVQMIRGILR